MRKKNKKEDKNSTHTQKKTKIVKNSYMGAMKSNKPKTSPIPGKKEKKEKSIIINIQKKVGVSTRRCMDNEQSHLKFRK